MRKSLIALVLCPAIAACERPSVADAETKFCAELNEFRSALTAMPPVTANTPVEQFREGWRRVQDEYDDLDAAARAVRTAQVDQVRSSYDRLEDAIEDIPGEATLGQGAGMVQGQVAQLNSSVDQALSSVQCPAVPASAEPERPGVIYTARKH